MFGLFYFMFYVFSRTHTQPTTQTTSSSDIDLADNNNSDPIASHVESNVIEQSEHSMDLSEPIPSTNAIYSITDAIKLKKHQRKLAVSADVQLTSDSNNNNNQKLDLNVEASPPIDEATDYNNNDELKKPPFLETSDLDLYRYQKSSLRNQQMQQLLQQHVFTPHQLQQLIATQQHASGSSIVPATPTTTPMTSKESQYHFDATKKQLELLMQQIQEQLQVNLIQQTHLLQKQSPVLSNEQMSPNPAKASLKHSPATLHLQQKLAIQQQELIQQFQIVQRQYFLHQGGMPMLFAQQSK